MYCVECDMNMSKLIDWALLQLKDSLKLVVSN